MKTAKWCLNCGKDVFRCFCRQTLAAHDEAPVEEPERLVRRELPVSPKSRDRAMSSSMISATYSIEKCKTVGEIFEKTFAANPKVRDHGTRKLR